MQGEAGRLVAGRYRLEEPVGDGGMGLVWRAVDERLGRVVAVKQLRLPAGVAARHAEQARQRVSREARIAARLQHPNAVSVYDVADDGSGPMLVMEYLPSRSLAEVLAERGALPPQEAAAIGADVAGALAAAHAAGVAHRDVKPNNILLGRNGITKLCDFGISRASGDVTVTSTGLLGTPAFLAPEAARGEVPGPAADVFSLGATLYTAVEGVPPFGVTENPIAQLHRTAAGHAPPPQRAGPLTALLARMLSDQPTARPSMAQVAAELASIAAGKPAQLTAVSPTAVLPAGALIGAPNPSSPAPTRIDLQPVPIVPAPDDLGAPAGPRRRRSFLLAALLGVGLLALILAVALSAPQGRPSRGAAPPAPSAGSAQATPASDPALLERAVSDYYALLPDHIDQAWTRLGPALQSQGRDDYENFWGDVDAVRVVTQPRASGDTVTVTVEYTTQSSGQVLETHRLGMVVSNGTPLINTDQLLSSQTVDGKGGGDRAPGRGGGNGHGGGRGNNGG